MARSAAYRAFEAVSDEERGPDKGNRVRLQKALASAGLASRRHAETYILDRRVSVNGVIVDRLGTLVDPGVDELRVDGTLLTAPRRPTYVLLNKPRDTVTTAFDPEGRKTVLDLIDLPDVRLFPVGRLDRYTTGALLLTDDGELAARLLHPRYKVEKRYVLRLRPPVLDAALDRMAAGTELEDGHHTQPCEVHRLPERHPGECSVEVRLREGHKRQVRLMAQACGLKLISLHRSTFAGLTTQGLAPGTWRRLRASEIATLRRHAQL